MKLNPAVLQKIAGKMFRSNNGGSAVAVGHTYIGQMISHDIVRTARPTRNPRSLLSVLNLDSIYDNYDPILYRDKPEFLPYFDETGRFLMLTGDYGLADFLRVDGTAVIPDARNDENIIVAQLHLFWMRLHNLLIDKKIASNALEARERVTLLFQAVVVEEFLRSILTDEVYQAYFIQGRTYLDREKFGWDSERIPDFFKFASFRFGHSIVRPKYSLSNLTTAALTDIFLPNEVRRLEHMIDWSLFFGGDAKKTAKFDTVLARGMSGISSGAKKPVTNIAQVNLIAANNADLPSGHGALQLLDRTAISELNIQLFDDIEGATYRRLILDRVLKKEQVPLWLYILHEASSELGWNGARLGPLGSMLNAEVLSESIKRADISISDGSKFQPELAFANSSQSELGQIWGEYIHLKSTDSKKVSLMLLLIKFLEENEQLL